MVDLLWDHGAGPGTRHSLSQLLWRIRRALPQLAIQSDNSAIRLADGDVALDSMSLLLAADLGDWRSVLRLYSGPFFGGLFESRTDTLDDWILGVDSQIVQAVLRSFEIGIATACEVGDWRTVLRLISVVRPIHADTHQLDRLSLVATTAMGDVQRAAQLALGVRGSLARPKRADGASLLSIRKHLATHEPSGAPQELGTIPFVGRAEPFKALSLLLSQASNLGPRFALIRGDLGVGKTRFCEHFLRYAAIRGWRVLIGVARRITQDVPFALIADLLRSSTGALDRAGLPPHLQVALTAILPESASSTHHEAGRTDAIGEVLEATSLLLRNYSQRHPLVLFLDQIDYADERSLKQICHLATTLHDEAVLVIACARAGGAIRPDVALAMDLFLVPRTSRTIELGELSRAEVWELFDAYESAALRPVGDDLRIDLYKTAGGNPFFLLELLRFSFQRDGLSLRSGLLPESITAALRLRLNLLNSASMRVLKLLAVVGGPIDSSLLDGLSTGEGNGDQQAVLRDLARRGLIVRDGHAVAVAQDLVCDTIVEMLDEAEKRALHGLVASWLVTDGRHPHAVIAAHFDRSGDRANAAQYFSCAASSALDAEAFSAAEQFARRALEYSAGDLRQEACGTLVRVLCATRRYAEARDLMMWNPSSLLTYSIASSLAVDEPTLSLLGDVADGRLPFADLSARALALIAECQPSSLNVGHAELIRVLAGIASSHGDVVFWQTFVSRSKAMAALCREDVVAALILSACACVEAAFVSVREADRTVRSAVQRAATSGRKFAEIRAWAAYGTVALLDGRLVDAAHNLTRAREVAQALGLFGAAMAAGNNLAVALMEMAEWRTATDLLICDLRLVEAHDGVVRRSNLCVLYFESGHWDRAEHQARLVVDEAEHRGLSWAAALGHAILGSLALRVGRRGSARDHYDRVLAFLADGSIGGTDCSYALTFLTEWERSVRATDGALSRLDAAIGATADKHVLAAMRLRVARCMLIGDHSQSEARRSLMDVAEQASSMGAKSVASRASRALKTLVRST